MTQTINNVAVYVGSEEQLTEAKQLLEKYGEKVDAQWSDCLLTFSLCKYRLDGAWRFTKITISRTLVTIARLELVLQNKQ